MDDLVHALARLDHVPIPARTAEEQSAWEAEQPAPVRAGLRALAKQLDPDLDEHAHPLIAKLSFLVSTATDVAQRLGEAPMFNRLARVRSGLPLPTRPRPPMPKCEQLKWRLPHAREGTGAGHVIAMVEDGVAPRLYDEVVEAETLLVRTEEEAKEWEVRHASFDPAQPQSPPSNQT